MSGPGLVEMALNHHLIQSSRARDAEANPYMRRVLEAHARRGDIDRVDEYAPEPDQYVIEVRGPEGRRACRVAWSAWNENTLPRRTTREAAREFVGNLRHSAGLRASVDTVTAEELRAVWSMGEDALDLVRLGVEPWADLAVSQ